MNTSEILNDLIIKFLSGEINHEEIAQLKKYLNYKENKQLFAEMLTAWQQASNYTAGQSSSFTKSSWNNVSASISSKAKVNTSLKKNKFTITRLLKIAALWIVLIGIGSLFTFLLNKPDTNQPNGSICEMSTPLGSRSHIVLPDGTEVWLNAGTKVKYPGTFAARQRDIYLTGEAYFKVKTNKQQPFVVHTSDVNIKAYGTAFNVKAYPSESDIVTTLVEGVVQLENADKSAKKFSYTMKPKEKLTFYKTSPKGSSTGSAEAVKKSAKTATPRTNQEIVVHENTNTILATSWKDPRWVINGESLDNLAVLLERRFDVRINFLSQGLDRYRFSGIIENETLEQVMQYIKLTAPITYTIRKGMVDITINEKLKKNFTNYLKSSN